jgi:predicted hydrolase (HD superfamily)
VVTVEELGESIDPEMAHAILAHADKAPRESLMDKALYAADPTTGFIVAAALVRPEKDLDGVKLKSLKKRWKEKAFARGASREQMAACADLELERDEFLTIALEAMQARREDIGL